MIQRNDSAPLFSKGEVNTYDLQAINALKKAILIR